MKLRDSGRDDRGKGDGDVVGFGRDEGVSKEGNRPQRERRMEVLPLPEEL
jgi:hypothetical protein